MYSDDSFIQKMLEYAIKFERKLRSTTDRTIDILNINDLHRAFASNIPGDVIKEGVETKLNIFSTDEIYKSNMKEFEISNNIFIDENFVPHNSGNSKDKHQCEDIENIVCINTSIHGIQFYKRRVSTSAFIKTISSYRIPMPLLFKQVVLEEILFLNEDMRGLACNDTEIKDVLLYNCDIKYSQFTDYELVDSGFFQISYSPSSDRKSVFYSELKQKSATINRHIFKEVDFKHCFFQNIGMADLTNVTFFESTFVSCFLDTTSKEATSKKKIEFIKCSFKADKISCNLFLNGRVELTKSKFSSLTRSNKFCFEYVDFTNCELSEVTFENCLFTNCKFPVFPQTNDDKECVCFTDCKFTRCNFVESENYIDLSEYRLGDFEMILEKNILVVFHDCEFVDFSKSSVFTRGKFVNSRFGEKESKQEKSTDSHLVFKDCILDKSKLYNSVGSIIMERLNIRESSFNSGRKIRLRDKHIFGGSRDFTPQEWQLSFSKCKFYCGLFNGIIWSKPINESKLTNPSDLIRFKNCHFESETIFKQCDFNGCVISHSIINNVFLEDCHKFFKNEGLNIHSSAIKSLIVDEFDEQSSSEKLHINLKDVNLCGNWFHGLAHYNNTCFLSGNAWLEQHEEKVNVSSLVWEENEFDMGNWGINVKDFIQRLYEYSKKPIVHSLHHSYKDPDVDEEVNIEKIKEFIGNFRNLEESQELYQLKDILSPDSFETYLIYIKNCIRSFERLSKLGHDEDIRNCGEDYHKWRGCFLKRYKSSAPRIEKLKAWIEDNRFRVDEKSGKNLGSKKLFLDYLHFEKLLISIQSNSSVHSRKVTTDEVTAKAEILHEEGSNSFSLKFYDFGEGFAKDECLGRWKKSKQKEFQEFTEFWCESAFIYTKIEGDLIKYNLRTAKNENQIDTSVMEWVDELNIGTCYVFTFRIQEITIDNTFVL